MAPSTRLLLTVCAAIVLIGAASVLFRTDRPGRASAPSAASDRAAAPRSAATGLDEEDVGSREPVAGRADPDVDLDHPFEFELTCRVIDRDGLPVGGVRLVVAPPGCALNLWPEATAADGTVAVTWRGRRPEMLVTVGLQRGIPPIPLRTVAVRTGSAAHVTLLDDVPDRCVLALPAPPASPSECIACHAAPKREEQRVVAIPRDRLHPSATFADRLCRFPPEAVARVEAVDEEWSSEQDSLDPPDRELGAVTGLVLDETGAPAAGVTVTWGFDRDRPVHKTRTDPDGSYRLERLPPGELELRAGGRDAGLARARATIGAGPPAARVDLMLEKGASIRGRAVDARGRPLSGHVVEFVTDDGRWVDACSVRADGSFELPNQPVSPGILLLRQWVGGLPAAIESGVTPGGFATDFDLRRDRTSRGALLLRARAPEETVPVEARVWQLASGRGIRVPRTGAGEFRVEGLPAGSYRVEVGAEGSGWRELGEHWVDGQTRVDLGEVVLPISAELRWMTAGDPPSAVAELYARRPYGDVRTEDAIALTAAPVSIPPGNWLVLWRDEAGEAVRARAFHAASGGRVTVDTR